MRKLGIALLVLLVASSAAVPTRAPAAPLFPSLLAPGAGQGQYLRVQYGGGDDDDDGPSYQPQHSHQHSNCCGGNGNAIAGLIAGVATMAIREGIRQKQINDYRQQQQTYQIQNQRQQQARKQNQRNQAAQQRRNNEEKARQKREEALANEKHQEEVDELNRQKRELTQLKKDIENQKAAEQNKPAGYPSDDNNPAGNTETRTDSYENESKGNVVINIIPSRPGDPDPGTLKVGPVTLYPSHIDLPPDRTICTGTTAKGCFLRIVTTPSAGGGSRQECILYCNPDPRPRPVPPPRPIPTPVVVVTPTPTPIPTPTPVVVVTPTPTPPPVVYPTPTPIPTPVVYPTPTPIPTPTPVIVVTPTPTPTPITRTYHAEWTVFAEETVVPKPRSKPAWKTVMAEETVVPKPRPKPAEKTVMAEETVVPKPRPKPAEKTVMAEETVVPKRKPKPAENTVIATEQKITNNKTSDSNKTVENKTANDDSNTDNKTTDDKKKPPGGGGQIDEAERYDPVRCPNINFGPCAEEFAKERAEEEKKKAELKKKEEERKKKIAELKQRFDDPGPPDKKQCTPQGDKPLKGLLVDHDFQGLLGGEDGVKPTSGDPLQHLLADHARTIVTTGISKIPAVGKVLGGLTKLLWKDPSKDELFDKMKLYVDNLVPDSITRERVDQLAGSLSGLRLDLKKYLHHEELSRKGGDLTTLIGLINDKEDEILSGSTPPEKALPLVLAFGLLKLTALREQYLHMNDYYKANAHDHSWDFQDYNDAVRQYAKVAADLKDKIIANRLAKIHLNEGDYSKPIGSTDFGNIIYDKIEYSNPTDDFCDWEKVYDRSDRDAALAELKRRQDEVRKVYSEDLDLILQPIAHWPSSTTVAGPTDVNGRPKEKSAALSGGANLDEAEPINPVECPNLNLGACGARFKKQQEDAEKKRQQEEKTARDEKKKRDDEIARKKKEDDEDRFALEHPGDPDSKGCTKNGDKPIATLLADPDYQRLLAGSSEVVPVSTESGLEKIHARDIVTTGLKAVPDVGAVLSGVVSFLWKDPKPDRLFNELVTYVNKIVPESITAERVGQQNFQVAGLRLLLQEYQAEGNLVAKGKILDGLKDKFIELEPAYLNNPDTPPEKVLPLVIAYGRLRLAVLRERLLHQKEYYPDNVSTLLVPDYNNAVKALGDAAKDIKQKTIDNRLAKLHSDRDLREDWDKLAWGGADAGPVAGRTWWYTTGDDFCDWHIEHKDDENAAKADLAARTDTVRKAYNRELDVLLAPITRWPSITPVAGPVAANGRPLEDAPTLISAKSTDRSALP
jgi:delta endotoxin, N-terminal domain